MFKTEKKTLLFLFSLLLLTFTACEKELAIPTNDKQIESTVSSSLAKGVERNYLDLDVPFTSQQTKELENAGYVLMYLVEDTFVEFEGQLFDLGVMTGNDDGSFAHRHGADSFSGWLPTGQPVWVLASGDGTLEDVIIIALRKLNFSDLEIEIFCS